MFILISLVGLAIGVALMYFSEVGGGGILSIIGLILVGLSANLLWGDISKQGILLRLPFVIGLSAILAAAAFYLAAARSRRL